MCEAVCWGKNDDPMQKKRMIVKDIVDYVFENHLKIQTDEYAYVADQFETVVFDDFVSTVSVICFW